MYEPPLPKLERRVDWVHRAKCCASFYLRGDGDATTSATAPPASSALPAAPVGSPPAGSALVAELQAMKALDTDGNLSDAEFSSAKRLLTYKCV